MNIKDLQKKFNNYNYIITDDILNQVFCHIQKVLENNGEIMALALFGPSGTGKTSFVSIYKEVLKETLGKDVKLFSFTCNYDQETMIEDKSQKRNVINKNVFKEAILEANKGSKIILLMDNYDEVDNLTDKVLANFIEDGSLFINEDEYVKLDDKNNLHLIIAGNKDEYLFETLKRRLNVIKTDYLCRRDILKHIDNKLTNSNQLVKYLIMYIYSLMLDYKLDRTRSIDLYAIHLRYQTKLPYITETINMIKDVEFLINSKSPMKNIVEIIKKRLPVEDDFLKSWIVRLSDLFEKLKKLNSWDDIVITDLLINDLKDEHFFEKSLKTKIKSLPSYKEETIIVKENETNDDEFINLMAKQLLPVYSHNSEDFQMKVNKSTEKDKFDRSNWFYSYMCSEKDINHKWFNIGSFICDDMDKYLKHSNCVMAENGPIIFQICGGFMPFNKIVLCRDLKINSKDAKFSIYASEPIISYQGLYELFRLLRTVNLFNFELHFGFIATSKFLNQEGYLLKKDGFDIYNSNENSNLYWFNYDKYKKGQEYTINGVINTLSLYMNEFALLNYTDPNYWRYIIPTGTSQIEPHSCDDHNIITYQATIGRNKYFVNTYPFWNNHAGKKIVSDVMYAKVKEVFDYYVAKRKLHTEYQEPYLLVKDQKFRKYEPLTEGVSVAYPNSKEELLLINPYLLCLDGEPNNQELFEVNKKLIKTLIRK